MNKISRQTMQIIEDTHKATSDLNDASTAAAISVAKLKKNLLLEIHDRDNRIAELEKDNREQLNLIINQQETIFEMANSGK